jgi:hypothetical protein
VNQADDKLAWAWAFDGKTTWNGVGMIDAATA